MVCVYTQELLEQLSAFEYNLNSKELINIWMLKITIEMCFYF